MYKVIVWGSGKYYRYKADYIKKNYEILAFVSKEEKEKEVDGYPIIDEAELKKQSFDKIIVMSERYVFEIVREIMKLGIENSRIILGLNLPPATEKEAQYLSEEVQLEINTNGNIIWNGKKEILRLEDIEECQRLHRGFMTKEMMRELPLKPLSYNYGASRGSSIARYYINAFVKEYSDSIQGTVMEIGDSRYTEFGDREKIEKLLILVLDDIKGEPYIRGDLETGEGLVEESLDCFILTNVLSCLFDVQAAVKNIGNALKRGGKAIITVPGIAALFRPDYETYGQYWRFTPLSMKHLLNKYIPEAKITIKAYGNAKVSAAFLYGMTVEDLTQEELDYRDSNYPMVIGAYVEKC